MEEQNIQNKIGRAAKWATITEIMAKLVTPISSMILARFVSPEAFGVVAIVVMVTSFAEVFTDAGFQKYLVQHEFENDEHKYQSATVAFWTNLTIAIILYSIIFIFRDKIAFLLGSPNSGWPIAVGSLSLLFISFSSIQMALYRRTFDFKKLFIIRIFAILVPFAITIPLALLGLSYWALIIGTLSTYILNAVLLTVFSKWKPRFFYNFKMLKEMFSFSSMTMLDSILIWLTAWVDIFIIGRFFNEYYLGLYRTSISLVNNLMNLVTAAIVPVLFAALSRLQNDNTAFNNTFLSIQRILGLFLLPIGAGVFLFRDLATKIMLGNQWNGASLIIGIWGLTGAIRIVFLSLYAEAFRAKGKAFLPALIQIIHLAFLIPVCIIFAKTGFEQLVFVRSLIRFQGIFLGLILMEIVIKTPITKILKNILPIIISTSIMSASAYVLLLINKAIWWQIIAIFICILVYGAMLMVFPSTRKILIDLFKKGYNKVLGLIKKPKPNAIQRISKIADGTEEMKK